MGKTISFVKGRGHISHNNRDFISNNVVPERTDWNRTYVKESIESAYDTCFGQALNDYNARQKRKDRQKHDYITEIRNSKNKENMTEAQTADGKPAPAPLSPVEKLEKQTIEADCRFGSEISNYLSTALKG